MRATGAASAALLGAAALALTAPTATAVDPFVITPSTVAPGGRVTLSAPGCAGTAMASSAVFDTATIPAGGSAAATVDWDARRGAVYTVSFTCAGGAPGTAQLTIARAPTTSSTAVPTVTRTVAATPSGVRGGLGGSVGGWHTGELVAGTALVVAAATGTVYVIRRRTAHRRH
ncbi:MULTISPECIES: hypothetical protein [unclassified Streptomyces]|uniref:hypothetical protein n=1 Tax=unclassified Streptomyces TaxID=2593676 RepID=UPI0008DC7F3D|nr:MULTISPECIES: hypothetical protein [unclassified Streptomyces]OII67672.1 hypothetical protein BJP39_24160 [Streptomyces sp. CC77]